MAAPRASLLALLSHSLAHSRIVFDPPNTLVLLEQMLAHLENELDVTIEIGTMTGLLLHLIYSTLPSTQKYILLTLEAREHIEKYFPHDLLLCLQSVRRVNQYLASPLPMEEAYNILGIFKQVDIFIDIGQHSFTAPSTHFSGYDDASVSPEREHY